MKQQKYAIVSGNAPSLAEIDYSLLINSCNNTLNLTNNTIKTDLAPKNNVDSMANIDSILSNFDIFRCNQFYFEDKYFLGKNVKFAFANPGVLFEQYYTLKTLLYKGEYNIENIVVSDFDLLYMDSTYRRHKDIYKSCIRGSSIIEQIKEFFDFVRYNEVYLEKRITSGIYMCGCAVALGYKNIYICGIDLYSAKESYAFNAITTNIKTIAPNFSNKPHSNHSAFADLEALKFLKDKYDVNFYCICPNSPLAKDIELPKSKYQVSFNIESKQENRIKDILIPPKQSYAKLYFKVPDIEGVDHKRYRIKQNFIFRVFESIIRLPSDIKHYVRGGVIARRKRKNEQQYNDKYKTY